MMTNADDYPRLHSLTLKKPRWQVIPRRGDTAIFAAVLGTLPLGSQHNKNSSIIR
jgi:hypothetical protein